MKKVLTYEDLTPADHRVLHALLDGLAMTVMVETDTYPYEETLFERTERERKQQDAQQENKP